MKHFANKMLISIAVNKRLDDWVTEDYLDTRKVQFPRKDGTATGQNTGVTTPKRFISNSMGPLGSNLTTSRPTSPKVDIENDLVNGNTVMAAAIQKKINRKRKVSIIPIAHKWHPISQLKVNVLNVKIFFFLWPLVCQLKFHCLVFFAMFACVIFCARRVCCFVSHLLLPLRISHMTPTDGCRSTVTNHTNGTNATTTIGHPEIDTIHCRKDNRIGTNFCANDTKRRR